MSASLRSQVRRVGMRPNVVEAEDCCSNSNNDKTNMNDSKGDCSCHKQRHRCNRLTCYHNNNNSGSSGSSRLLFNSSQALPLFIKLTVLMLAMPIINAAILRRSVAETSTALNITTSTTTNNTPLDAGKKIEYTTANTPIAADYQVTTNEIITFNNNTPSTAVEEEIDLATASTPHLANAQTTTAVQENIQSNSTAAEVPIVNEAMTTTVEPNVIPAILLNTRQDVNNEIHHDVVASANIATEVRVEPDFIKPKFEYTETLLDGNLEETIRNSVKNEIEFEHDIGAAVIEQLQEVTDPEERQKLSDEILAIQSAQHSSARANNSESVDVFTGETSNELAAVGEQQPARAESAAASTTPKDLSIYFPSKIEVEASTEKDIESSQRNARNLNEKSNEESEAKEIGSDFVENEKMQNIEEENVNGATELINESKNHALTSSSDIPDTGLYSHEANEITEDDSVASAKEDIYGTSENIVNKEHSIVAQENVQEEKDDDNELAVIPTEDNELSIVLSENLNATEENNESESLVNPEEIASQTSEEEVKSPEGDEASLSVVLDENLSAAEPVVAVPKEQLEHLLNLNVSEPLLIEEVDTTEKPETVKSIHIVIKKQGVELEEGANSDETTIPGDLENETTVENDNKIGETTVAIIVETENGEDEIVQTAQNDDAAKEEATKETDGTLHADNETPRDTSSNDELEHKQNEIQANNDERNDQEEQAVVDTTDPTSNELDATFEVDEQAAKRVIEAHNEHTEKFTPEIGKISQDEAEEATTIQEEIEESNTHSITEELITHSSTTQTAAIGTTEAHASSTESQTTTLKEFEVYEDNTDDPDIVPILVGVSSGQSDLTASTKGSRSINTQTHHSMLLTQMDDAMAATLFETFPPQNAGQMFNDHLAAESSGGRIGKPLPAMGISKASTSASLFSGSGLIIVLCASVAFMFLLASVVAFVISFQRQRGTLDIEMQEQRCGKDNLDEEDEVEVGACTKLLDIELPKSTIVALSEELEECL